MYLTLCIPSLRRQILPAPVSRLLVPYQKLGKALFVYGLSLIANLHVGFTRRYDLPLIDKLEEGLGANKNQFKEVVSLEDELSNQLAYLEERKKELEEQIVTIKTNISVFPSAKNSAAKRKREIFEEGKMLKAQRVELKEQAMNLGDEWESAKKIQADIRAEWSKLGEKFNKSPSGVNHFNCLKLTRALNIHNSYLQLASMASSSELQKWKLWMHDLLQEMTKEIIRNESPREPGQRSRIWFHEDILHDSSNLFKLKSLRTLSLTGCCKLRKFPEIAEKMDHLTEILLQGTSIKELPESIEYLVGLRFLFLEFCREHLPSSLHKLQCLTCLDLTGCSKFRELPINTRSREASNCISLERFPQLSSPSSFTSEELPRPSLMRFINCHKLINKQEYFSEAAFPGNEVPDWFDYHSTNGSISLEVASGLYGKPLDLYFGAVVELDKAAKATGMLSCGYDVIINDHKLLTLVKSFYSLETSHVWLNKIKCSNFTWSLNFLRYWNNFEVSFWISQVSSKEKVKATLKSCGFHILCKQQGYQIDQTLVRKCVR
ncbi:hypothetical protein L6164_008196 [Bauhinia variegata]|uniref:Uncharacterized protein n=1 Tax=Bauhinia variegata TaxID=167791 RepID=A0ACB9PF55_BAUVA|nr:hypothetical protein L6164_008196 [Bauhinia variegata]